jgi:hypothetical protein
VPFATGIRLKNGLGTGLAVAVGVAVLGPIVMPALARGLKPVVKGAIKGGIVAYGWGREGIAEMREYMEDTYAEAQAEMEHGEAVTASARSRPRGRKPDEAAQPT